MCAWRRFPLIHEIDTWPWLEGLARHAGKPVELGNVPDAELDRLTAYGFDGVWLMGVWQRSPRGREIALAHPDLQAPYRAALSDFEPRDVVGSPYAVYGYEVEESLGGNEGLAALRERLARRGLSILLDFVPNHVALDHPWTRSHPERILQGTREDLVTRPSDFFAADGGRVFAHGRDPYFPGWSDTAQLDYRRREIRNAMAEVLLGIAARCDGVRCDMAMLLLQDVFCRTWGGVFDEPGEEFWPGAIARVKAAFPAFLLVGEVYWNLEDRLQRQGFDYVYDKRLYDDLLADDAVSIRHRLGAERDAQDRLVHFVENHDERRAAECLGADRSPGAATLALGLPGMRLTHEGQLEGRRVQVPIQLGRWPDEPVDSVVADHYRRLFAALSHPVFCDGDWRLLEPRPAWDGNPSHDRFVAYRWQLGEDRRVAVANLSSHRGQCLLPLDLEGLSGCRWRLKDLLGDAQYPRDGDELIGRGLYLDLPGYGCHLFEVAPHPGAA